MSFKYIDYADFDTWKWKTFIESKETTILDFMGEFDRNDKNTEFYIGTDSQNRSAKGKKFCVFTSVLVAYTRGHGGRAILATEKVDHKITDLRRRLMIEAWRSLEVGMYLNNHISPNQVLTIHLDVNDTIKYKSGEYKNELVGLVTAQSFNCEHKPNAWAASFAADKKC